MWDGSVRFLLNSDLIQLNLIDLVQYSFYNFFLNLTQLNSFMNDLVRFELTGYLFKFDFFS